MPIKISPSILSADFAKLGEEIIALDKAGCDYIHIDVMDGHFVPNITIGPAIIKSIRKYSSKPFDVHLMIDKVNFFAKDFAAAGADIITFHYEAVTDIKNIISLLKDLDVKIGISIKPNTNIEVVFPYLPLLDLVLVMTVEPGFSGQKFIPEQLDKITTLKKHIIENEYNTEISVDGGINAETAKKAITAGADVLVAGAYIFADGSSYLEKISSLRG